MLVLPSRRLVRPATDDDFVICQNAPCEQVLALPSQRLVRSAADDDFVIRDKYLSIKKKYKRYYEETLLNQLKALVAQIPDAFWDPLREIKGAKHKNQTRSQPYLQHSIDHYKNLCDYNWTRTHNHLARKRTLTHLAKLALNGAVL